MGAKIEDVFEFFVELTGLKRECVDSELGKYLNVLNLDRKSLCEDDLRRVMSLYLEDLNCSMVIEESTEGHCDEAKA